MGKNILCILSSPRQNSNSGCWPKAVRRCRTRRQGRSHPACGAEHQSLSRLFRLHPFRQGRAARRYDGSVSFDRFRRCAGNGYIYYFNMSGQLKTFIDRCIAVDVGGGKRGLRGKKLAVTMAYEGEDPFDSGCINAIRCFQDICRYTGMELKGQAYGTALEPGAILANKKLLDEARELGRILLS
ncbi:MAG: flavodoxin family protein [Bilophila wadsworthia]